MSGGLATTFRVLAETENEAAVRVLVPALDSPLPAIREEAVRAILERRSALGAKEILRRLGSLGVRCKVMLQRRPGRLAGAIRDAVLGNDLDLCRKACRAAVWLREYDSIPTLLNALEDPARPTGDMVARALLSLAKTSHDALPGASDGADRPAQGLVRRHVLGALEASLGRFGQHRRREAVEAFLLVADDDNAALRDVLGDPHHPAFLTVVDLLSKGSHGALIRLLLAFLDDAGTPSAAISIVANRGDAKFVQALLHKLGRERSAAILKNLRRIKNVGWLRAGDATLDQLDETAQRGAVRLVMTSGMARMRAFSTVEYLLLFGKPAARREAARALAEFRGAEANELALKALGDPDPQVQANVLPHLRPRGIPGVLPRLVELVDSPHAVVRKAARESLSEFSFKRFAGAFEMLTEEVRQSTGALVKKIDPQTVPLLREELRCHARARRLRAMAIASAVGALDDLETEIIELLGDEDHMVRAEAASALSVCGSPASRAALEAALGDRSETVKQAAQRSLRQRDEFARWRQSLADPRD